VVGAAEVTGAVADPAVALSGVRKATFAVDVLGKRIVSDERDWDGVGIDSSGTGGAAGPLERVW
jgi:hypothetical protein